MKSILIYGHKDLLGDGFIKLPFLRALKTGFPNAKISWYVGSGNTVFLGILKHIGMGLIHEIIQGPEPVSMGIFNKTSPWHRHFDLIIDTQRNLGTAFVLKQIPHRKFISPAGSFILSDYKSPHKIPQLAAQLVNLVELCTGPLNVQLAPLTLPPLFLEKATAMIPGPAIGLVPGAGGRYKCWPLDLYIELAHWIFQSGRVPVFLLGPQEQDWRQGIEAQAPFALFPGDQDPSVEWSLAVGSRLMAAVANDCGGGHLLGAVDVPLVSLFGPTPAHKFAPLTSKIVILKSQDFGSDSMESIPIDAVKDALAKLIKH